MKPTKIQLRFLAAIEDTCAVHVKGVGWRGIGNKKIHREMFQTNTVQACYERGWIRNAYLAPRIRPIHAVHRRKRIYYFPTEIGVNYLRQFFGTRHP